MIRTFTALAVPAALFLALLGAGPVWADAAHDVRLDDERTGVPLHTDTYLVNTNASRGVTVGLSEMTVQDGRTISQGAATYEMKPGEKVLIGHAHDGLRTTRFTIVSVVYNDLQPTAPERR